MRVLFLFFIVLSNCQNQQASEKGLATNLIKLDSTLSNDIIKHLEYVELENDEHSVSKNHYLLKYALTKDSTLLPKVKSILQELPKIKPNQKNYFRKAIKEKSLEDYVKQYKETFIVRLSFPTSFTEGNFIYRIQKTPDSVKVEIKRWTFDLECDPKNLNGAKKLDETCFNILEHKKGTLNIETFEKLKKLIQTTSLSSFSSDYEKKNGLVLGGDFFKIEVINKFNGEIAHKYSISRQSSGKDSPLKLVGNYIIEIAQQKNASR